MQAASAEGELDRREVRQGDWVEVVVVSSSVTTLQSVPTVRLEGGLLEYERWKAFCGPEMATEFARENELRSAVMDDNMEERASAAAT
ncbi:MAG: hypothetical protein BJ554DRAFT_1943 [Olpidium bornovanus]|uniref:Uncharacterized protein n=1 Tax=Olpidium bornovanus TaxID=278681 RepID=A0A8H7ZQR3_9FUNG|nr:MAG: hypothetical protein BJ554DRAFT_1943 [Olpidium bornovanus]